MQSNWEKYKRRLVGRPKQVLRKPTLYYLQMQENFEKQRQERREYFMYRQKRHTRPGPEHGGLSDPMARQAYSYTAHYSRTTPVIVSHISILLYNRQNEHYKVEHIAYLSLFDTKTEKVLYETYIQTNRDKYRIVDAHPTVYNLDYTLIDHGKLPSDVREDLKALINYEEYYVGFQVKRLFTSHYRYEVLSSHLCDLYLAFHSGHEQCNNYAYMLVLAKYEFTYRVDPEDMGRYYAAVWNLVKYRYDYEVAQHYKARDRS